MQDQAFGGKDVAHDRRITGQGLLAFGRSKGLAGKIADDIVVALPGVGQGKPGADLQGPAGGVAAVGPDECVVDAAAAMTRGVPCAG